MPHLNKAYINALKTKSFEEFDAATLTDISDIRIDNSRPPHERAESVLRQTHNPYLLRVGNTPVRISFADNGPPLESQLVAIAKQINW